LIRIRGDGEIQESNEEAEAEGKEDGV